MAGYIILAAALLLVWLVFFLPYGVDAGYAEQEFFLKLKAGPLRFRLLPKKPLTERQRLRAEKKRARREAKKLAGARKKAASAGDKTEWVRPKRPLDAELLMKLLRLGIRAVRRLFRSFTVEIFSLHYTAATGDPYNTARQYAWICSALETLPALCAPVIRVRRRDVTIGADYVGDEPELEGRLVLTIRLFRLVWLALALGAEFISLKLKRRKNEKRKRAERKDDNGGKQDQRGHGFHPGENPAVG